MAGRSDSSAPVSDRVTPMMAQFLSVKEGAGDALLFYRMGDFYELFFEDAVKAAAALDIALTKRGKYMGEDIPMCGVPVATAETYLARLITAGFRVAVCEQMEDPAEAKKRGGPVRREVVRVVTPGTVTEESLLDARAPAYLAAFAPSRKGEAGLTWADVSTGEFRVMALDESVLAEELGALGPKELLVPDNAPLGEEAMAVLAHVGGATTPWPAAKFAPGSAERRLKEAFAIDDLEGFGSFASAEIAAAGALVEYLDLTQAGDPVRLSPPRSGARADVVAIDPATRASLEIDTTLSGERAGSLLATIDRTVTGPGARELAGRLARPLVDPVAINARLDAVEHLLDNRTLRAAMRDALRGAGDPARALTRLLLGRGGPRDLAALSAALRAGDAIAATFAPSADGVPLPAHLTSALEALSLTDKPDLAALASDLERMLEAEPPIYTRDGGFIASGVDEDLDAARKLRDDSRRVIAGLQAQYADLAEVSSLKVKHNHQIGYFVEVGSRHGDRLLSAPLNETFIHRQTMANAMRFSTAELSRLEAEIAGAAERARSLELSLFNAFVERARELADAVRASGRALARLDADAGLAEWAEETRAVRADVDDSHVFDIKGGRHPVVEAALTRANEPFTPNQCQLDALGEEAPRLVLVTGPNMAGKSTYLRQNALIAILAQAGSFVPAAEARIGCADRVFSRVGAADDLARGRSTFMAEMIETAAILNQAGPRALVILDEIGRGTATFDGLAIAWAAAEHIYETNGCRALFATHYHELTRLADQLPAGANVSLKAKEWRGSLVFLHEVGPGPADRSYGVEVARRAGLPKKVVARARSVLEQLEAHGGAAGDVLADLPLFAASPRAEVADEPSVGPHPALERLAGIDADGLSPRAALDLLFELKALVDAELV